MAQRHQRKTSFHKKEDYDYVSSIVAKMDNVHLERPEFPPVPDRTVKTKKLDPYQQQLQKANKDLLGKLYYEQVLTSGLALALKTRRLLV